MSEQKETAMADANAAKNGRPKHMDKMPADLANFYMALGRFNSTIVARAIHGPETLPDLTKILTAECPTHDASCDSGYQYNHVRNVCLPKDEPLQT